MVKVETRKIHNTPLKSFKGFYVRHPNYILTNPIRNLLAIIVAAVLIFIVWVSAVAATTPSPARLTFEIWGRRAESAHFA